MSEQQFHVIEKNAAVIVLGFLNDLDIPTKSLKRCIQIMSTLPRIENHLEETKED